MGRPIRREEVPKVCKVPRKWFNKSHGFLEVVSPWPLAGNCTRAPTRRKGRGKGRDTGPISPVGQTLTGPGRGSLRSPLASQHGTKRLKPPHAPIPRYGVFEAEVRYGTVSAGLRSAPVPRRGTGRQTCSTAGAASRPKGPGGGPHRAKRTSQGHQTPQKGLFRDPSAPGRWFTLSPLWATYGQSSPIGTYLGR